MVITVKRSQLNSSFETKPLLVLLQFHILQLGLVFFCFMCTVVGSWGWAPNWVDCCSAARVRGAGWETHKRIPRIMISCGLHLALVVHLVKSSDRCKDDVGLNLRIFSFAIAASTWSLHHNASPFASQCPVQCSVQRTAYSVQCIP